MSRSNIFLSLLFFYGFLVSPLAAGEAIFRLFQEDKTISFSFEYSGSSLRVSKAFRRGVRVLLLTFFEDGTLIPDRYWRPIHPIAEGLPAGPESRLTRIRPGMKLNCQFGLDYKKPILDLSKDGRYFAICFLKKGQSLVDGFWASNWLEFTSRGGRLVSASAREILLPPIKAKEAFEGELAKVRAEESIP